MSNHHVEEAKAALSSSPFLSFAAAYKNVLSSTEKLIERIQDLEKREQDLETQLREKEQIIMKREEEANKWQQMQNQLMKYSCELPSSIDLNVSMLINQSQLVLYQSAIYFSFIYLGGKRYTIPKEELLKHKGSYFEAMLQTSHQHGEYVYYPYFIILSAVKIVLIFIHVIICRFFVNRDQKLFEFVWLYILTLKYPPFTEDLIQEFEFFKLPLPDLKASE